MTDYAPGTPSWVDVTSPDLEASKRFYGELFGWTADSAGDEYGGYTTFRKDGKSVAAATPLPEGQPPSWTTYFATDDADAIARKVEAAGGKVAMAPMDVPPHGRMAVLFDQAGAVFGIWQAGEMKGAEVTGETGTLSWNELLTRDLSGSQAFYSSVFGHGIRETQYEGGSYTLLQVGDQPVAGMMQMTGEMFPPEIPSNWMVYFNVDDTDAIAARTAELGGTVAVPPTDVPPGRFAVLTDPHGATFSVIKANPDFQP